METKIKNDDLDIICQSIIIQSKNINHDVSNFFLDLYNTGLRWNELYYLNNVTKGKTNNYLIKCKKHDTIRNIDKLKFSKEFHDKVYFNFSTYTPFSIFYIKDIFYRCSPYSFYMVGNKKIVFHLFRYNFVRRMRTIGFTEKEIISIIGWKKEETLNGYLNNEIIGVTL